jgi:glyoxylase-like metal-dependent hydrolase (beta-lactamase superfamily II)
MRIMNVGYRSVNCYLIVTGETMLLFDVGWPNGMPDLKRNLAQNGVSVKEITHVLNSHYHIDHAGITQEVKDKGARLIVMENQKGHLNDLKKFLSPPMVFHDITDDGNIGLRFSESREFLAKLGLRGEIVPTIGHCPDHVTLVLDSGEAFTGDLPPENATEEGTAASLDWHRLRKMGVRKAYPAHGSPVLTQDA